jgi:hypothetical protein
LEYVRLRLAPITVVPGTDVALITAAAASLG